MRSTCLMIFAAALMLPSLTFAQGPEEASTVQEDELVTDRPDFTESSSTVPTGRLQLESGLEYSYLDAFGGVHAVTGPNLLARIGVADFAELRVEVPNVEYASAGDFSDTGFGEASVGAKFATAVSEEMRVGVIPFVEIGVDDGDFGGGLIGTFAFDLSDNLGLGVNAGFTGDQNAADEFDLAGRASIATGYSLTDELGVFLEGFAIIPEDDVDVFIDAGVTYMVAPLVQLDAYVGTDIPDADLVFGGAGVSVLF